jgi:Co/Zn/Cd efflux system component
MKRVDLSPTERRFLERSADLDVTRRRIRTVLSLATAFAVLLVAAGLLTRSWALLLAVAVLYVIITTWERVTYAGATLVYKRLVQKLKARVEELEERGR